MEPIRADANLRATSLLDFHTSAVKNLVSERDWADLPSNERIGSAYDFVRNEITFGYNAADNIPASTVLKDGYGQCNTKATLLMALLRALEIPCRLHGFTIHKSLQRGVVPELVYRMAPDDILHSWVEVLQDGRWINLEGFILDQKFLSALQTRFADQTESLCGYGVGTDCLSAPPVAWVGEDTYIQKTGINGDLGVFDDPDSFYLSHRQSFGWLQSILYRFLVRHRMNTRVRYIRLGIVPIFPGLVHHDAFEAVFEDSAPVEPDAARS